MIPTTLLPYLRRSLLCVLAAFALGQNLAAAPLPFTDVFVDGADGYPVNRIPALIKTKAGTLLAFAEGRASRNDQSQNKIILKRSTDGGLTWSKAQIVHDDGANSLNNPTPVVVRETGRVLLMFQRYPHDRHSLNVDSGLTGEHICRGFITYSDDDGLTWSAPVDITSSIRRPTIATYAASGPGIGIQLARGPHAGRILFPFNEGPVTNSQVYAVFSDDLGQTWKYGDVAPYEAPGHPNEVQMAELTDGSVLLNARNQLGPKVRRTAVSHDGGETWSAAVNDPALVEPICAASLLRHSVDADPAHDVLLFSNPFSSSARVNGTVRLSRDDGRTWPVARTLYPGGFSYSCLVSLDTNTIGCIYEERDRKAISFCRFSLDWLAAKNDFAALKEPPNLNLFNHTNLVAWCIVPFDAKKRGPEERAAMLQKLGFKMFAYDYRAEHIPTFDAEIAALQQHHIRLLSWWFPTTMNDEARLILDLFQRHDLHPQLWVMGGGEPTHNAGEQAARVASETDRIRPIAEAAAKIRCTVALYNHGGWFGDPDNQIAIIERLRAQSITNVGLVYNLHHGHADIDRFPALLARMKPYLKALTLNGMVRDGDQHGKMVLPIGEGDLDPQILTTIAESGWQGPLAILNHTDEDAETRLQKNLAGLDRLVAKLRDPVDHYAIESAAERNKLPLYETIPAATPEELTPNQIPPRPEAFLDWHRSHGDNAGTRFSGLTQVNRRNVQKLQVAWTYHSQDATGNIQCNPVIAHGVMFAPTPGKNIVAVDALTGKELWRFKPEGRPAFRGLIYWPGGFGAGERVLFCAGKFLYALDPKTGKPVAGFGTDDRVELPGHAQGDFGAATAAPAIFQNTIIVPGFEKDVWAFDAVTGTRRWTFHTVPEPGEFGADTWERVETYAANCWAGMALDEARGIAYVTTGSPKENFIGANHVGQNLFANCVIALDARTGKRLWHFQEIRHDIWDLDISSPPNLTTITRDGRRIDVVTANSKMGNTLLLDRVTGKPIFPFRLRRAPVSDLPGERTWPYQPDLELPEPVSKQNFSLEDVTDRSEEAHDFILSKFKSSTSGWFQPFSDGKMNIFYGLHGGVEWTGACVDPTTGRLYVSVTHMPWIISVFRDDDPPDDPKAPKTPGQLVYELRCASCHGANRVGFGTCPPLRGLRHRLNDAAIIERIRNGRNSMPAQPDISATDLTALVDYLMLRDRPLAPAAPSDRPRYSFNGYNKLLDQEGYPGNKPPWGTLHCLDLNTGKMVWTVPLGEHEELTARGIKNTGTENFGGAIVTAGGLVFCSGTRDNKIRAFDSDTGKELWSAKLPWTGSAPPATYQVDHRQFIVVPATGGGKLGTPSGDAYVAFALPPVE